MRMSLYGIWIMRRRKDGYVTVDASGRVTYASYRAQGSTTNSKRLVDAAVEAARKARFSSSESLMQTGTITYVFTLE